MPSSCHWLKNERTPCHQPPHPVPKLFGRLQASPCVPSVSHFLAAPSTHPIPSSDHSPDRHRSHPPVTQAPLTSPAHAAVAPRWKDPTIPHGLPTRPGPHLRAPRPHSRQAKQAAFFIWRLPPNHLPQNALWVLLHGVLYPCRSFSMHALRQWNKAGRACHSL